jgi:hypothetical protein
MFFGVWLVLSSPPRWLLARGLPNEAWQSAGFVYVDAPEAADATVAALKARAVQTAATAQAAGAASSAGDMAGQALGTGKPPLYSARNRRAMVVGLGVVTLQQVRERKAAWVLAAARLAVGFISPAPRLG